MTNTPHRSTSFLSSHPMEDLEIRKRIINLGKALVNELGLDNSVDTLARWMAHYVAEQIDIAENAIGTSKAAAEKNCFDTILKLWKHQAVFPGGKRPFENFESIFRALERMDPENERPFFWRNFDERPQKNVAEDIQHWLDIAIEIDKVARVWIKYIFKQAAINATDDRTTGWLKNAVDLDDNESSVIFKLLYDNNNDDEITNDQKNSEKLTSRIQQLKTFNNLNEELISISEKEREDISKKAK